MNALAAARPDLSIVIRTAAARRLFDQTVRHPFVFIEGACDTGVVQIDSLRLDEDATIRHAAEFHRRLPGLAAREAALLREHDARFVVADTAPLAPVAASAAGVPSVVLANFTWDWIYEGYPEALAAAPDLIPILRGAYRHAGEAWRLPLHGGFTMFDRPVDLPFIARHATLDRADVRRRLRLPADDAARAGVVRRLRPARFRSAPSRLSRRLGHRDHGEPSRGRAPGRRAVHRRRPHVCVRCVLRRPRRLRGRRRHEARVRHRDRMPGQRYGDALHVARALRRVRRDGGGDAALPALRATSSWSRCGPAAGSTGSTGRGSFPRRRSSRGRMERTSSRG